MITREQAPPEKRMLPDPGRTSPDIDLRLFACCNDHLPWRPIVDRHKYGYLEANFNTTMVRGGDIDDRFGCEEHAPASS